MKEAVQNSYEAFLNWREVSVSNRARRMFKFQQLIIDNTVIFIIILEKSTKNCNRRTRKNYKRC
jgi:acyl-CoA reductase-like NAD-dependent aldehyde dehydrogenase